MQAYKKQCGRPEIRKSQQVLIDKAKFSNSSSKNVSINSLALIVRLIHH
jgi:hypothetical protein